MPNITIYRFSQNGFQPFEQTSHKDDLLSLLELEKEHGLSLYPKHLRPFIQLSSEIVLKNWMDYTKGIFVFLSLPSQRDIEHLLNHLDQTQIKKFSWWKAEIDGNEIAFDPTNNNLWKINSKNTILKMIEKNSLEIYLPEKSLLTLHNIQKITHNNIIKKDIK